MPSHRKLSPLIVLRIIWASLILSQLFFGAVVTMFLWPQRTAPPDQTAAQMLTIVATGMMLVLLPLGFVIRRRVYQASADGKIATTKYLIGNIIFYAICESVAFTGLIAMLLQRGPGGGDHRAGDRGGDADCQLPQWHRAVLYGSELVLAP